MDYGQATQILNALTPEQRSSLALAHERYYCFVGIASFDEDSDRQAEADRKTYAHLLLPDNGGVPCISQERATEFMSAVSGLPQEWCLAWDEYDFCELHGQDHEARAAMNGGYL